jgi:Tol biopolymer transport system component
MPKMRLGRPLRFALVMAMVLVPTLALIGPAGALTGTLTMASHSPAGPATAPVGQSRTPRTSANGDYVVFVSTATNLVSGQTDTNGALDVFLYQRSTGAVTLVSHAAGSATTAAAGVSDLPVISADGAYVAFDSTAKNLVAGLSDPKGAAGYDVFLWSRATNTTTIVSHSQVGLLHAGNDTSRSPSISADGSFVVFESYVNDLVPGTDALHTIDSFLYTRATGAITLISHTPGTSNAANATSGSPVISANGAFVVFGSLATNLVTGQSDANGAQDVFLFERSTGSVTLVSHTPASVSTTANAASTAYSISADGAYLAFQSEATNIVGFQADSNAFYDVFLYSRSSQGVTLVSHTAASASTAGNDWSHAPLISADGGFVVFGSYATNLVTGQTDTNGLRDQFLFTRATGVVTLVSHIPGSLTTTGNEASESAVIAGDGSYVAFYSYATNLVTGQADTSRSADVFLLTRATGEMTLLSHTATSNTTTSGQHAGSPSIGNGPVVAFNSRGTNHVAGQDDANGTEDVFVFTRTIPVRHPVVDFDGDGDSDISVFRPSNNTWYVRNGATTPFGAAGDIPVPCDYNGNGTVDIAIFRPSVGGWFINGQATQFLGASGDVPVPGDYDGDGDCDVAVYRPSVGGWYRIGQAAVFSGLSTDIPVPADYDGNATADFAVYRPSVGGWYRTGGAPTVFHGLSTDIPVPADYDGNATADFAVYRPSVGGWYVNGQATQFLGLSTDIPVPGDYDGNGVAERAVFRPASGAWYVAAQPPVFFGLNGDRPLALPSATRQVFFP